MNIICNVTRGTHIESQHRAYAIVIDEGGKTLLSSGPPNYTTCIRSALKPFQASAAILSGATEFAGFNSEEIALMCSSHNGEKIHIKIAMNMAKKLGLDLSNYECGSHLPFDKKDREETRKSGATPFHNNCSGKHSGMLSLAKKIGTNPKGYTKINHPVQKIIFKQLKKLTGYKDFYHGIDGCSAPTPFMSLITIAKLFQKLGSERYPELTEAYSAMARHPYLVGGKNRFDTDFISALKGRGICKAGGEAVRGLVVKTTNFGLVGIALKVIDGNQRAIETATMALLAQLKLLKPDEDNYLKKYKIKPLYNHKNIHIGDITAELFKE